jgi:hypothetical protein
MPFLRGKDSLILLRTAGFMPVFLFPGIGDHVPVSIVYGAINLFWLLPVVVLAFLFKAGVGEEG